MGELVEKAQEGTLIFFVRKISFSAQKSASYFFCDGLGSVGSGWGGSGSGCDRRYPVIRRKSYIYLHPRVCQRFPTEQPFRF